MSTLQYAKFYYLDRITISNNVIPFSESDGVERDAMIQTGSYTPTTICQAIAIAMTTVGAQTYSVSFNRTTRLLTISAPAAFTLKTTSSNYSITSPFSILGFSMLADLTGANSYTGTSQCGHSYGVQFPLQDLSGPNAFQMYENATVLKSADGKVRELYSTGSARYMEMNIKYITSRSDLTALDVIRGSTTGFDDAWAFMKFAASQCVFEYMKDDTQLSSFLTLALESTQASSMGVGFQITPLNSENLPDFYETGKMKMRVIE